MLSLGFLQSVGLDVSSYLLLSLQNLDLLPAPSSLETMFKNKAVSISISLSLSVHTCIPTSTYTHTHLQCPPINIPTNRFYITSHWFCLLQNSNIPDKGVTFQLFLLLAICVSESPINISELLLSEVLNIVVWMYMLN